MKREDLISVESKKLKVMNQKIIDKDLKFLNRSISDLERDIEDSKEKLEERLSNDSEKGAIAIDKSTVEVLFYEIKELKSKLSLYRDFKSEYYGD